MPVAQGGRTPARQAAVVALGAMLGVLAVVFLVSRVDRLTGGDGEEVTVGNPVFTVGRADEFAPLMADEGPLLLQDAARGDRDLWLHHLGDSPADEWVAFAVRPPGAPRECFVEWSADDETFVDNCDGTVYPETGDGLEQYAVSVNPDGDLVINLTPIG